jgi:hypothetical protein
MVYDVRMRKRLRKLSKDAREVGRGLKVGVGGVSYWAWELLADLCDLIVKWGLC